MTDRRPTIANTGPRVGVELHDITGTTISTDGTVLENVRIKGTVTIAAHDVTIRNFMLDANGAPYGIRADQNKTGLLLDRGTLVSATNAAVYGSNYHARRLNIYNQAGDALKADSDCTIEWCYMHNLGMQAGKHADGLQMSLGTSVAMRYCNIDMPIDQIGFLSNACAIIQAASGPVDDILLKGNWFNGGNYTLFFRDKGHGAPTNVRLISNRFGRNYRYGLLNTDGPVYQSGNVWDDTGEAIFDLSTVKKP